MKRLTQVTAATLLTAVLANPASAGAAVDTADTAIAVDPANQIEMHITANCALATGQCTFNTRANLMTPEGPIGFPGETWARQTITLRSPNRDVWQEAYFSAPSGMPPENKASNHDNVLSKAYKSISNVEIAVTTFGGGPIERFSVDGTSVPTNWTDGRPNTTSDFIACTFIHVVYNGVDLTTPTACAQTRFS